MSDDDKMPPDMAKFLHEVIQMANESKKIIDMTIHVTPEEAYEISKLLTKMRKEGRE